MPPSPLPPPASAAPRPRRALSLYPPTAGNACPLAHTLPTLTLAQHPAALSTPLHPPKALEPLDKAMEEFLKVQPDEEAMGEAPPDHKQPSRV